MSGIDIKAVEELNKQGNLLNAERQKLIGMRESAKQSLDKAILVYKEKYGVDLNNVNLQDEFDSVYAQMVLEYQKLSEKVASIQSGGYKKEVGSTGMGVGSGVGQGVGSGVEQNKAAEVNSLVDSGVNVAGIQNDTGMPNPSEDISERPFTPEGWGIGVEEGAKKGAKEGVKGASIEENFKNILNMAKRAEGNSGEDVKKGAEGFKNIFNFGKLES